MKLLVCLDLDKRWESSNYSKVREVIMLTSQQEVIQLLFNRQCCSRIADHAIRSLQQTQDVKTSIELLKLADHRLGTLIQPTIENATKFLEYVNSTCCLTFLIYSRRSNLSHVLKVTFTRLIGFIDIFLFRFSNIRGKNH
jgi:hypothetical protein